MNKFTIGDRVKAINVSGVDRKVGLRNGDIGTIDRFGTYNNVAFVKFGRQLTAYEGCQNLSDDGTYRMYDRQLELVSEDPTIVIYRKDREVIVNLKEGNKVVKSVKARCNPSDTFDFEIGAKLAVSRLLGAPLDSKEVEKAAESEVEEPTKTGVNGVKIGDTIKILYSDFENMNNYKVGEIHKVVEVESDGCPIIRESNNCWDVVTEEFEIIAESDATGAQFDWNSFKSGKFAVHCDTEEKAEAFLKECDRQGIKWNSASETPTTEFTHWSNDKREILYFAKGNVLTYSVQPEWHKNDTVIDYTPSKPAVKEVYRHAKVGEFAKVLHTDFPNHIKVGEICKVVEDGSSGVGLGSNKDGNIWHYHDREYVVLEGYTPEDKPTYTEVHRPAKVGEWIKVVVDEIVDHDGKFIKNGDIIKIEEFPVLASIIRGKKCIGFLEEEYVVLENYQPSEVPEPINTLADYTISELLTEIERRCK